MSDYPFHQEVQKYFPGFNYESCSPRSAREMYCNMAHPNNKVGHQQRAFSVFWAINTCDPLNLGLDLGSTRGLTPYCIHVDKHGTGRANPLYLGQAPVWADVVADMGDLSVFPDNCFPVIVSNHSIEHVDVTKYTPDAPVAQTMPGGDPEARKRWVGYTGHAGKGAYGGVYGAYKEKYDAGLVKVLREHWIRVLRPPNPSDARSLGGVIALVVPDHAYMNVFDADGDHRHAWRNDDFKKRIIDPVLDLVDLVEFDTLQNGFSFNVVLRKKAPK